ncbi:hypothetical protein GIB67_033811 [Kingdonia uniflora]|uniref:Uncharacterized protein n=1 Tax=Kingdonia uniflora TaxID=39325 RepID=A0A7J7LIP0_9MAGN|nr:hypothetical protein GIB67_033811 [Kingdonia uniflora]
MASNTNTTKGSETTVVNTVDHRSPAGQDQPETNENVQIIHETQPAGESAGKTGVTGALLDAKQAANNTFETAKKAVSGNKTTKEGTE